MIGQTNRDYYFIYIKIWPGLGEAVCTHSQACRGVKIFSIFFFFSINKLCVWISILNNRWRNTYKFLKSYTNLSCIKIVVITCFLLSSLVCVIKLNSKIVFIYVQFATFQIKHSFFSSFYVFILQE